jgi:hypothetical protein
MPTKLTLRLDENLIQAAKNYAHLQGRSVSVLVAEYFAQLTHETPLTSPSGASGQPMGQVTSQLRGALTGTKGTPADVQDYKHYLDSKYQ